MEIVQLLLSLLHAWGMEPELDRVCETKLGLLRPMVPVSCCCPRGSPRSRTASLSGHQHQPPPGAAAIESELPREMVQLFTARTHWELSTTLTTNHLLATISLAYTLMSMNNATFVTEQERNRMLRRQNTRTAMSTWTRAEEEQAHIKQGWSRLATLHCVL
ncbi:hypothetical protein FOCC_FOCC016255 [Frankliniella occidentalis]|nr:hypothetical protein FOCC_FOCC016255 [Frankliniella occidentalis]